MKRYLLPLIGFLLFLAPQAHAASFSFYRSITVTSTPSIASGTNLNFPMLVSSTYADWASSAHGGTIQNLTTDAHGNNEAADFVFATSTPNCTAGKYLNFETESYSSTTGALIDWVNVPSMSTGTVIYACYDASSVTTDQSHPSSTWNSNYVGVYHFFSNINDSTANGFNMSIGSGTPALATVSGFFGRAEQFTATSTTHTSNIYTTTTIANDFSNAGSISYWAQSTTTIPTGLADPSEATDFYQFSGNQIYNGDFLSNRNGPFISLVNQALWNYMVITRNSSVWSIYQNGTLLGTSSPTTFSVLGLSNCGFMLGNNYCNMPADVNAIFNGNESETHLLNTALTSQWILTEYNNQVSPDAAQSSTGFYAVGAQTAFSGGGTVVTRFFNWIREFGW